MSRIAMYHAVEAYDMELITMKQLLIKVESSAFISQYIRSLAQNRIYLQAFVNT
jgi:hypothetical protein